MLFLDVLRFSDYAGPDVHSRITRTPVLPSHLSNVIGALRQEFSKLNSPARRHPCLRFDRRLATPSAKLGAKVAR